MEKAWRRATAWAAALMCAWAGAPGLAAGDRAPHDLAPPVAVAYLEDPSGKLTVDEVAAPGMAARFVPAPRPWFNFGFTDSAYWLRITVPPGTGTRLVEISTRNSSEFRFFRPDGHGGYQVVRAGVHHKISEQDVAYRFPVFRTAAGDSADSVHYLRATGRHPLEVPLHFWTEDGFERAKSVERLWFGAYLGAVAVMAVYNLFVYLAIRDRAYLWYVACVVFTNLTIAARNGLTQEWLWPEAPDFDLTMWSIALAAALPSLVMFTRELLGTRLRCPRTDTAMRAMAALSLLAPIPIVAGLYRTAMLLNSTVIGGGLLFTFAAGILAWRQRVPLAPYYVAGYSVMWVAGLAAVASGLRPVSGYESVSYQGYMVGALAEVLLFSLALAARINLLKQEKEKAQAEALASQGRALEAARRSEAELEQRVVERTEALARAKDEAQQANLAKTRFLAAASHDLRQPMHAIGLLVGALRERVGEAEARRLVDKIDGSVEAMDGLFNALLDISKLDSGSVQARPVELRLQTLLDALELGFAPQAQEKGLRLRVRRCEALVRSDPVLLDRILRNLVANAIRYTDEGGVLVGARLRGGSLRIEVWDSGVGIPAEKHALVFEEFVQLANPTRDRAKGLGLGLSIVRRLAQLLGHEVALRSVPGKGSVFSLTLPYLGRALALEPAAAGEAAAADLRGVFVLVIDDEPDILEGMGALLGQFGAKVACARSGPEAVDVLREHLRAPDLIISDYRIAPDHTGIDAIRLVREAQQADIPALLITGDSSAEDLNAVQACGLPVVFKPVSAARIRAVVAGAIADRGAP